MLPCCATKYTWRNGEEKKRAEEMILYASVEVEEVFS
jgi:hypothetical protein